MTRRLGRPKALPRRCGVRIQRNWHIRIRLAQCCRMPTTAEKTKHTEDSAPAETYRSRSVMHWQRPVKVDSRKWVGKKYFLPRSMSTGPGTTPQKGESGSKICVLVARELRSDRYPIVGLNPKQTKQQTKQTTKKKKKNQKKNQTELGERRVIQYRPNDDSA